VDLLETSKEMQYMLFCGIYCTFSTNTIKNAYFMVLFDLDIFYSFLGGEISSIFPLSSTVTLDSKESGLNLGRRTSKLPF
jgi:hypothetical protein